MSLEGKRKSLWIINFFAGNRESGWGERHFFLSKQLTEFHTYDVVIISSSYNHMFSQYQDAPNHFNFAEYEGIKFCWVRTPRYRAQSILRFWAMMVFSVKLFFLPVRLLQKPDFILMSSMPLFPILPAWYLKRKLRAEKLIFEVRDLWPLTPVFLGNVSRFNPLVLIMQLFENFACKRSDIILSLLPKGYHHLNRLSRRPDKCFYLPNGIGPEVMSDSPLPFSLNDAFPAGKFIVGYAGTLGIANAMSHVVEAARRMVHQPDVHFVLIGEGYLKPELERQADGLSNITFLPKIKKGQVFQVLALFDLGIISWNRSKLYEFGVSANKFFDYMLAGKPILVAGELADNPVQLAECGLVVAPEDPEAICAGIKDFMAMPVEKRSAMGLKGKEYVKKHHSYEVLASQLNGILTTEKK